MEHSITRAAAPTAPAEKPLADRLALPLLKPRRGDGHARVAAWLSDIADRSTAAVLARILDDHPAAKGLIADFAEAAPYLWDLVRAEPARLLTLLQYDPDLRFEEMLAAVAADAALARDEAGIMALLRRLKAEAALLIALADIGGIWDVIQVTRALTEIADTAVRSAVGYLLRLSARAGRHSESRGPAGDTCRSAASSPGHAARRSVRANSCWRSASRGRPTKRAAPSSNSARGAIS